MDTPLPTRPDRASAVRWAIRGGAGLVALYATGQLAARLPAFEKVLRARVGREIAERVGANVSVGPDVHVDWAFRAAFGPVQIDAPDGTTGPLLRVERVRVRPSGLALLTGRLEPGSVRLVGVRLELGPRASRLRALLAARERPRLAHGSSELTEPPRPLGGGARLPTVHLRDVVVRLGPGDGALELGPLDADLDAALRPGGERADLAVRLPDGAWADVSLSARDGGLRLHARAARIGPTSLPAVLGSLPARLEAGSIGIEVDAEAPRTLERADGRVRIDGQRLEVGGERVAAEPVGPIDVTLAGALRWDGRARRLSLADGEVAIAGGALRVRAAGGVRLGPGLPFSVALAAERVEYAALVGALPPALAPPADAPRARGTFAARLEADGPLLAPAAWHLAASLDLGPMRQASRRIEPQPLRGPFVHRVPLPEGAAAMRGPGFVVGSENPDFVPIAELPLHVVRAVTASEDAGFFAHHGFDFTELGLAFAAAAEQGRAVRGGSTISQQVAKNLFLGREKTLARKVREATLTLALEAALPKARILEIYLNVAEWGPGVFGIGPAARHWFGKDARALTPREAAFLATVIPNPVRYEYMRRRGLSPAWTERVNELLQRMAEQGTLTDEQLSSALAEPLVFTEG